MSKHFCEFAGDDWQDFFEAPFKEVADAFEDAGADWDIIEFAKTPHTALVIVQHGLGYTSSLRLVRYPNNGNGGPAGCLYGLGGRYVGGGQRTAKVVSERAEFISALRRKLAPISPRPQPLPHDEYVGHY